MKQFHFNFPDDLPAAMAELPVYFSQTGICEFDKLFALKPKNPI